MKTVEFNAGDTILTEREDGQTAFLILEGSVEVSIGEGKNAKTITELKQGDVFGEMSLLEPGPRSATVKALGNTKCVATSHDDFMLAFVDDPQQAIEFMKTLVRRLRQMNELMVAMDPKKRGFREMISDWQKAIVLEDDLELTDEERKKNWILMQSHMPFY